VGSLFPGSLSRRGVKQKENYSKEGLLFLYSPSGKEGQTRLRSSRGIAKGGRTNFGKGSWSVLPEKRRSRAIWGRRHFISKKIRGKKKLSSRPSDVVEKVYSLRKNPGKPKTGSRERKGGGRRGGAPQRIRKKSLQL